MTKHTYCVLASALLFTAFSSHASENSIKLYTLDCGTIDVADMASFDREGRFDGQPLTLKVPCYLIRHPKGDLVWDTGLDDRLASTPNGIGAGTTFHSTMDRTLKDQLAELELTPADIEYLSLSHWHPDHSGNANLFGASTWIANRTEKEFMFSEAMEEAQPGYAALANAPTILFDETYDVFGDGKVVIHSTPGHTPGHSVLLLALEEAGSLLFSGDLYAHSEGHRLRAIPVFNSDAEQTILSQHYFEKLATDNNARIIIEHDAEHFKSLPRFPAYLE